MDSHGVVCEQEGVFRVNCIDCLDRTNVVQTALAKWVLENQVTSLIKVQGDPFGRLKGFNLKPSIYYGLGCSVILPRQLVDTVVVAHQLPELPHPKSMKGFCHLEWSQIFGQFCCSRLIE